MQVVVRGRDALVADEVAGSLGELRREAEASDLESHASTTTLAKS
jgi:hypothetical protein